MNRLTKRIQLTNALDGLTNRPDLIFVQLAVAVLLLALVLEGDDNETDENVHHEEGDDDDENEIEAGYHGSIVVDRPLIFVVRINRDVQQPFNGNIQSFIIMNRESVPHN